MTNTKTTPIPSRKTGEHEFAPCGGLPRCITCGADEDDAYTAGEACSFVAKRPVLRFRRVDGDFRDSTDFVECKHGRTYVISRSGVRKRVRFLPLRACRQFVKSGSWKIIE